MGWYQIALSVLLSLIVCSQAQTTRSTRTCSELSAFGTPERSGSPLICGGSKVSAFGTCVPKKLSYSEANAHCSKIGARLCTSQELANDETKGTGCNLDLERVWSSTKLGCLAGSTASQAGAGDYLSIKPIECTDDSTELNVRCCADVFDKPCANDECASRADIKNVCVPQSGSYVCKCDGTGWTEGIGSRSCRAPSDPCLSSLDPCKTKLSGNNRCISNKITSSFRCSCGDGFSSFSDPPQCVACADPCSTDPCGSQRSPENKCFPGDKGVDGCRSYQCSCAVGFVTTTNAQSCQYCGDPCAQDPCNSARDPSNVCGLITGVNGQCATHICSCGGNAFVNVPDRRACRECVNPCASDPCNTAANNQNQCRITRLAADAPDGCACGFSCTCFGAGWLSTANQQSCKFCSDPCQAPADPCKLGRSQANTCMMALGPKDTAGDCPSARICSCKAPFVLSSDLQSCLSCPDLCRTDPCNSQANPGNTCNSIQKEGACPAKYECSCAQGWLGSPNSQGCLDCPDPCASDPCRSGMNPDNVCKPVFSRGKCPTSFECACQGVGFLATQNKQSCTACPSKCDENPCGTEAGNKNTCVMVFAKNDNRRKCPTAYTCSCGPFPSIAVADSQSCTKCSDPCQDDPCNTAQSSSNVCTVIRSSTDSATGCPSDFVCSCGAFPWISAVDKKSCTQCSDPCASDPCLSNDNEANKCQVRYTENESINNCPSEYVCQCDAFGYITDEKRSSCSACQDPCNGDPCSNGVDSLNRCIPLVMPYGSNQCASYTCQCHYPVYTASGDGKSCSACINSCDSDPCKTTTFSSNTCQVARVPTDTADECPSVHICACTGASVASPDQQSCIGCPDVCANDPCSSRDEDTNKCVPSYVESDTTCPSAYKCECGGDFLPSFDGQVCEVCTNPCLGDPCNSVVDASNKCTVKKVQGRCDTHSCTCGGDNFFADTFSRSCQACSNPCENDPCVRQQNDIAPFSPLNTCTQVKAGPGVCGGYVCDCRGDGWSMVVNETERWNGQEMSIEEKQTCQLCPDPCLSDPCDSKGDSNNRCQPFGGAAFAIAEAAKNGGGRRQRSDGLNKCGGYRCVCDGDLFIAPLGAQECRACLNPCDEDNDPCNKNSNPNNRCVLVDTAPGGVVPAGPGWIACSTYQCVCGGVGWVSPAGDQSCQACPDPCSGSDPCGIAFDSNNKCVVSGALPDLTLLTRPGNAAGRRLLQDQSNQDGPALRSNSCPGYTCSCSGAGWMAPIGSQSCQPCPNPCRDGDPCNRQFDQRNVCVPSNVPMLRRQANGNDVQCGGYTCECSEGWITGVDAKSCLACPSPCISDPCSASNGSRNSCKPVKYIPVFSGVTPSDLGQLPDNLSELCGGYTCDCTGSGWLSTPNKQSCTACPNPCENGDPCLHNDNDQNTCVPDVQPVGIDTPGRRQSAAEKCGGYTCACRGTNYFALAGAQQCSLCTNPCANDPCYSSLESKNICEVIPASRSNGGYTEVQKCASYECKCQGEGWLTGHDRKTCEVCPDPCKGHDPCLGQEDNRNTCVSDKTIPLIPADYDASNAGRRRRLLQTGFASSFPSLYNTRTIASSLPRYSSVIGPAPVPAPVTSFPRPIFSPRPTEAPFVPAPLFTSLPAQQPAHFNSLANLFAQCGGYTCKCDGTGFMTPAGEQHCDRCPNPCTTHGDPCKTGQNSQNKCIPDLSIYLRRQGSDFNGCGGYTCECSASGWLQPADAQSCTPCPNPCNNGDPCSRNKDNRNSCVPNNQIIYSAPPQTFNNGPFLRRSHDNGDRCGGYTCTCASGWVTPDDKQSCQRCPNPCDGIDPCNNKEDPRNICVPDYQSSNQLRRSHEVSGIPVGVGNFAQCGSYTCQCGGAGWVSAPGRKSCSACPNPCLNGDPCSVNTDSRNYCVPNYEANNPNNRRQNRPRLSNDSNGGGDGLSNRQFSAFPQPGITFSPAQFTPAVLPTRILPSSRVNDLGSFNFGNVDNGNPSSPLGRCGVYKCECGAPGWMSTGSSLGCVRCPDPCLAIEDPCGVNQGYNNKCIRTTSPINLAFDANDPTRKCGGFTCDCGPGFIQSSDGKRCDPCPNPCLGRDPCATSQHPNNRCIPDNLGQYAQTPSGNAINGVFVQGAGLAPGGRRRLMSHDDVSGKAYYYQGGQCGGYVCQCAGPLQGWIAPTEQRACIPCNNPCQTSDPCSSTIDPRNVCVPIAATGLGGPADCGSYTCRCRGVGFVPSTGGQSCRTCPNPCQMMNDPCNTRLEPNNVCNPNYSTEQAGSFGAGVGGCGSHTCTCNGAGWQLGDRSASCMPKPAGNTCGDPCLNDPCNTRLNPSNRCINQANVQCGYYQCQCAAGWNQVQPVVTQGPTCQLTGDRNFGTVTGAPRKTPVSPPAGPPAADLQGPPIVVNMDRSYWG